LIPGQPIESGINVADEHSPAFVLKFAKPPSEAPVALLLFDAGPGTDSRVWDLIVRSLDDPDILVIDIDYPDPSACISPPDVAAGIVQTLAETRSTCPSVTRTILVGSKSGCLAVQIAMSANPSTITDLVLIDPEPADLPGAGDQFAPPEAIRIPATIILHGATSTSESSKRRLQAQEAELSRFSNHRLILAGRSSSSILSQRPDVVIYAIQRHLKNEPS
jgi:hypothetical protein